MGALGGPRGPSGALGDPMGALGGPRGPSGALGDPTGALGGPRGPVDGKLNLIIEEN